MAYRFTAPLWRWRGDGAWHFISLPEDVADDIEQESEGRRGGFGSVKVLVTVGGSTWSTSLFPSSKARSYILPMKRKVREAEGIDDGDDVEVSLELA
jgi:hypothetical protein